MNNVYCRRNPPNSTPNWRNWTNNSLRSTSCYHQQVRLFPNTKSVVSKHEIGRCHSPHTRQRRKHCFCWVIWWTCVGGTATLWTRWKRSCTNNWNKPSATKYNYCLFLLRFYENSRVFDKVTATAFGEYMQFHTVLRKKEFELVVLKKPFFWNYFRENCSWKNIVQLHFNMLFADHLMLLKVCLFGKKMKF